MGKSSRTLKSREWDRILYMSCWVGGLIFFFGGFFMMMVGILMAEDKTTPRIEFIGWAGVLPTILGAFGIAVGAVWKYESNSDTPDEIEVVRQIHAEAVQMEADRQRREVERENARGALSVGHLDADDEPVGPEEPDEYAPWEPPTDPDSDPVRRY